VYLEIDEGFPEHRKTLRFCHLMQNPEAWSYLIRLWRWACRCAKTGSLLGMHAHEVELAMGWREMDGRAYAAAVEAGFIVADASGDPAAIHDWMDYTGRAIARMEQQAEEKKLYRKHCKRECDGADAGCLWCIRQRKRAPGHQNKRPRTIPISSQDSLPLSDGHPTKSRPVQTSPDQSRPAPPDPERARVAGTGPEQSKPWLSAYAWWDYFGKRWCMAYRTVSYGFGSDGKAQGTLTDQILTKTPPEVLERLWTQRERFVGTFLQDVRPDLKQARHPFAFFVSRWSEYRPDLDAVASPPKMHVAKPSEPAIDEVSLRWLAKAREAKGSGS
jgi:hypothetical protein